MWTIHLRSAIASGFGLSDGTRGRLFDFGSAPCQLVWQEPMFGQLARPPHAPLTSPSHLRRLRRRRWDGEVIYALRFVASQTGSPVGQADRGRSQTVERGGRTVGGGESKKRTLRWRLSRSHRRAVSRGTVLADYSFNTVGVDSSSTFQLPSVSSSTFQLSSASRSITSGETSSTFQLWVPPLSRSNLIYAALFVP